MEIANSLGVVSIGSASFSSNFVGSIDFVAIGYSTGFLARVVGNFETIEIVVGYFA